MITHRVINRKYDWHLYLEIHAMTTKPPPGGGGAPPSAIVVAETNALERASAAVSLVGVDSAAFQRLPRELQDKLTSYWRSFRAENTFKAYRADMGAWLAWCQRRSINPQDISPATLSAYLVDLTDAGHTYNTISRRLSTLARFHDVTGHGENPARSGTVRATLTSIRRKVGRRSHKKAPVLRDDLVRMLSHASRDLKGLRDRAILLMGFDGAFRSAELVGLTVDDLTWRPEGVLARIAGEISTGVKSSKTNQEGRGEDVVKPLAYNEGAPELCAPTALRRWLDAAKITEGYIFRPFNRWGGLRDRGITPKVVIDIVKHYAELAGLDPKKVASHSLRAGHVTQGFEDGVPPEQLMGMTGHKSIDMLLKYRRLKDPFAAASTGLLKGKVKKP